MQNNEVKLPKEHREALADRDWWQLAGDILGLKLFGFTYRAVGAFRDPADHDATINLTGKVAERLITLSAIPSTVSGETKSNYPEIPDGWKLVPVEPTDEQIAAGLESLASSTGEPILHIVRDALFAYRSMLAASPANPAETQAVEVGK